MPNPILAARIEPNKEIMFSQLAQRQKLTPQDLLRNLIDRAIAAPRTSPDPQSVEPESMLDAAARAQWEKLAALAAQRGMDPSNLLHAMLEREVANGAAPQEVQPDPTQTELVGFTVRFPKFLIAGIEARAAAVGMSRSRWITALAQSSLMRYPVLPQAEVMELEATRRELTAMGRNINQIARALNEAHFETERVRLDRLTELSRLIQVTREGIRKLVRASRGVWVEA